MRARSADAAVEHLTLGQLPPDEITVPFGLLAACEGRDDQSHIVSNVLASLRQLKTLGV